jgi:hypothetical protein
MHPYRLSLHARVCVTPHGAVLLDLSLGKYLGLDPQQSQALSVVVEGWTKAGEPLPAQPGSDARPDEATRDLAEALRVRGLLVRASSQGHRVRQPSLPAPTGELLSWNEMRCPPIRPAHLLTFLHALLTTLVMLRWRQFGANVARCERRRARCASAGIALDLQKAAQLVSAYQYIRTWIFARRGRCLLDSLVLLEFLALHGVYPRWVIGVQARPFAAHAWLQHRDLLFNVTPEFARPYTPILIV